MKSICGVILAITLLPSLAVAGDNFYVGAFGGYGSQRATATIGGVSGSATFDGGRFGGFAGADFGLGNGWLVGLEGDLSYDANKRSVTVAPYTVSMGSDIGASVRGKVGYDFGPATLFAAGGWTGTNAYVSVTTLGSANQWFNGWTIGGGIDWKLTEAFFARTEYRYNKFETIGVSGIATLTSEQHVFNAGVGIRF